MGGVSAASIRKFKKHPYPLSKNFSEKQTDLTLGKVNFCDHDTLSK